MNLINKLRLRTLVAVCLLSLAIMAYEIFLMQHFSIIQWHHFAGMVISIAMLGFGASGTLLSLYRTWMIWYSDWLIPFFMVSCGILMTLSLMLSQLDVFLFDSYTLFRDQGQLGKLAMTYLFFFLPFLVGALAIGLIFIKNVSDINLNYFADLLGAGLGALFVIFLFWKFNLKNTLLIISLLPIVSGLLLIQKPKFKELLVYSFVGFCLLAYFGLTMNGMKTSSYKSISYALNLPEASIEQEQYSPYGLTQVVSSPVLRYAPGLSFQFDQTVHANPMVYNNGNWIGSIPIVHEDQGSILDYTTMALPYRLRSFKKALVLNATTGLELRQALHHGVQEVHAVESNAMVLDLLENQYALATDSLYFDPRVNWHNLEARAFIDRSDLNFDLIQLPLLGSFGGSVGLEAMKEEFLITSEAFEIMWNRLEPEGLLAVSCWIDQPPKLSLKLANMISDLLNRAKLDHLQDHILMIRSWGTFTFVISKTPFSSSERRLASQFCELYQFDPIHFENDPFKKQEVFNEIQNKTVIHSLTGLFGNSKDSIVENSVFNIEAASDNRPYFYQFLRLENLNKLEPQDGSNESSLLELGYLLALVTLAQVIVFATLFILLPLFRLGWKGHKKIPVLGYFAALGLGYMFVEIVLIKYFIRYIGHPIYSVAMVIALMLIFSGLGSLFASRFHYPTRKLKKILVIISALILIYLLVIPSILNASINWPMSFKFVLITGLIGLPAFFMGMPFPMGLKLVDQKNKDQVPWAWGINGCLSVISSVLAPVIALEMGFSAIMWFGALAYIMALITADGIRSKI